MVQEGSSHISLLIAHEYQRMWITERDAWKKHLKELKVKQCQLDHQKLLKKK